GVPPATAPTSVALFATGTTFTTKQIGTGTVDPSTGNWTITTNTGLVLPDGTYNITATQTDLDATDETGTPKVASVTNKNSGLIFHGTGENDAADGGPDTVTLYATGTP